MAGFSWIREDVLSTSDARSSSRSTLRFMMALCTFSVPAASPLSLSGGLSSPAPPSGWSVAESSVARGPGGRRNACSWSWTFRTRQPEGLPEAHRRSPGLFEAGDLRATGQKMSCTPARMPDLSLQGCFKHRFPGRGELVPGTVGLGPFLQLSTLRSPRSAVLLRRTRVATADGLRRTDAMSVQDTFHPERVPTVYRRCTNGVLTVY